MVYLFTRDAILIKKETMKNILNSTLFGKYKVISLLGTGSFGAVYLSKHKILECYRAIKLLPKHSTTASYLQEALLLKSIHHSGIPILYDIEEDDDYFYLIEEYAQGESLEEFLLHQPHISYSTFIDLSLQLCNIFLYLHTIKPSPILYLDLKPEHIIVCGLQIKLIDFNVATFLSNMGNIFNLFGNTDFSAPELFLGVKPSLTADIYSIGKMIHYLANYLDIPINPKIHQIIQKATHADPACRFETVDKLISAIENEKENTYQSQSRKKIAVVGSHTGCGTTHISIALVSTLNYMGYSAIYYECGKNDQLRNTQRVFPYLKEQDAMLCYKYFKGFPNYGPGIVFPNTKEVFSICDYGNSFPTDLHKEDVVLFICSNSFWHWHEAVLNRGSFSSGNHSFKVICNMGQKHAMHWLSKQVSLPIFRFAYDANPFFVNQAKCDFVTQLLKIKRRKLPFFHLKKLFSQKKP